MKRIYAYLNPIEQFGKRKYSYIFPFFGVTSLIILSESYAYFLAHDPNSVGLIAIFIFIASIIYFSFRDGLRGGLIATTLTIAYYFYIIYTRHYQGKQFREAVETTISLATVYLFLAGTIGWLRQTIDTLIEREADEKTRLQAIVQQLPVGVVITDNLGKVVNANQEVEDILGIKIPVGHMVGKELLLNSESNGKNITASEGPLARTLQTGEPIVAQELKVERKDGRQVYVSVTSSTVQNSDQKIIAGVSIITDVTRQKELELRKDDFVNMASHELKTPLTSMKLYIETLMRNLQRNNDDKSADMLTRIKKQTERLQTLASDLFDVTRVQTGKLSLLSEKFDIVELISETVDTLQESTEKHTLLFENRDPIFVNGDKFRIYQVLTNLLTNAIKYSPQDTQILLKVIKTDNQATISVQDRGIGIAPEQHQKIFDRLYQVADDKERTFPGLGLGLFISKEIVNRHGGKIWLESDKGQGTTFYFSLPLSGNLEKEG